MRFDGTNFVQRKDSEPLTVVDAADRPIGEDAFTTWFELEWERIWPEHRGAMLGLH